jgi:hypothetical protein
MDSQTERGRQSQGRQPMPKYEPPRVEKVLTPAELEREVLYAGDQASGEDN